MRVSIGLLLVCLTACAAESAQAAQVSIVGGQAGSAGQSALPAETDFHALVKGFLNGFNREVLVTCPCRVQQMAFGTMEECVAKQIEKPELIDCASMQLAPDDSPALRDILQCRTNQSKLKSDCLATTNCDQGQMNKCYELGNATQCAVLDPQLLTRVLYGCPDAMLLAR